MGFGCVCGGGAVGRGRDKRKRARAEFRTACRLNRLLLLRLDLTRAVTPRSLKQSINLRIHNNV